MCGPEALTSISLFHGAQIILIASDLNATQTGLDQWEGTFTWSPQEHEFDVDNTYFLQLSQYDGQVGACAYFLSCSWLLSVSSKPHLLYSGCRRARSRLCSPPLIRRGIPARSFIGFDETIHTVLPSLRVSRTRRKEPFAFTKLSGHTKLRHRTNIRHPFPSLPLLDFSRRPL